MLDLTRFNTTAVAKAGAALCTLSATALGGDVTAMSGGTVVAPPALVAPFIGLAVGLALTYIGRPSSALVPKISATAETPDATAPDDNKPLVAPVVPVQKDP
jgi:hypothetical protein